MWLIWKCCTHIKCIFELALNIKIFFLTQDRSTSILWCGSQDKCVSSHTDKSISLILHHDETEVMLVLREEVVVPNVSGLRFEGVVLQNNWSLQDHPGTCTPWEPCVVQRATSFKVIIWDSNPGFVTWASELTLLILCFLICKEFFIEDYLVHGKQW